MPPAIEPGALEYDAPRIRWGAAALVSFFALVSVVVGIVTQIAAAALFGAGAQMDAYLAGATLPQFLYAIFGPAATGAIVPVLVAAEARGGHAERRRLARRLIVLAAAVVTAAGGAGCLFAAPLLRISAPGLGGEAAALAVAVARIWWVTAVALCIVSLGLGMYHATRRFGRPAVVPVAGAAATVGLMLLLGPRWGVRGWAAASLLGALLQLALLAPGRRAWCDAGAPGRGEPPPSGAPAGERHALGLMLPLMLSSALAQAPLLVDRYLASGLAVGSIAYLGYARKMAVLVNSVVTSGIVVTSLPGLARDAALADLRALRAGLALNVRIAWVALAPAMALLAALRYPVVQLFLGRGAFTAADVAGVAALLPWFALALGGIALGEVLARGFYVLNATRALALVSLVDTVLYLLYAPLLARRWGYLGLGAANAVLFTLSAAMLAALLWRRCGREGGRRLAAALLRTGAIALAAGLAAHGALTAARGAPLPGLLAGGMLGAIVYAAGMQTSRAPEWRLLVERLGAAARSRAVRQP